MTPGTMMEKIPLGIKVPSLAGEGAPLKRLDNNEMPVACHNFGCQATGVCALGSQRREGGGMGYSRAVSLLLGCILPLLLSWEVALPVEATVQVCAYPEGSPI